jgi:hypothetical protein
VIQKLIQALVPPVLDDNYQNSGKLDHIVFAAEPVKFTRRPGHYIVWQCYSRVDRRAKQVVMSLPNFLARRDISHCYTAAYILLIMDEIILVSG